MVPRSPTTSTTRGTSDGGKDGIEIKVGSASNMIRANNALYCPGGAAVNGSGLTGSGLTISANYVEGALSGAAADGSRFVGGGTAAAAFAGPAQVDF